MANEALIKVVDNYEILIDSNRDHEAREFLKVYVNPNDETQTPRNIYRKVGHYSNVPNALDAISKDMAIQTASKKENVSLTEYTRIIRESNEYMMDVIRDKFPDLL